MTDSSLTTHELIDTINYLSQKLRSAQEEIKYLRELKRPNRSSFRVDEEVWITFDQIRELYKRSLGDPDSDARCANPYNNNNGDIL